jgi:thymidylate synthase
MNQYEAEYKAIANYILTNGDERPTRNAITKSVFPVSLKVDLTGPAFPMLQSRKLFWKGVVGELATFLQGPRDLQHFQDNGCNYWGEWADNDGKLNVDYGNTWLDFNGVNQLQKVVESLRSDPYGRRHLISGWKPDNLDSVSLPCCHFAYQWYVTGDGRLDMLWHQRSADWMVGVPSDVILASVWNLLMARTVGLLPGHVTLSFGDAHVYSNHYVAAEQYINAASFSATPSYWLSPEATVFNFTPDMFAVTDYEHGETIKFDLIP